MEDACSGLMAALKPKWRGGVTAYVVKDGDVWVGCEVVLSRNVLSQYSVIACERMRRTLKRIRKAAGKAARRFGILRPQGA